MLQLTYISTVTAPTSPTAILTASRRNNTRDGVTGLLFYDGTRFLQVLEGEKLAVERAYTRIGADSRHRALVVLSRRQITEREFGPWAMAERVPGQDGAAFIARIEALIGKAAPGVRATFDSFARLQRAA